MRKIKLVTDNTCDLNKDYLEEKEIKVMPLPVTVSGITYLSDVNIDTKQLFEKIEETGEMPKTANINWYDFTEVFQELIAQDYDVIYIGIGQKLSSTYQNAILAAREFPEGRITILDSDNLSSGTGLSVVRIQKLIEEGKSVEDIIIEVNRFVPLVRAHFAINTFEYLHKGGRCSSMIRIIGTVLRIKPIIKVTNGKLDVAKKPMGIFKKAIDAQLDYLDRDKDNVDLDVIFITHCFALDEDIEYAKKGINMLIPNANIVVTNAGTIIACHCGPRTIGILYALKK